MHHIKYKSIISDWVDLIKRCHTRRQQHVLRRVCVQCRHNYAAKQGACTSTLLQFFVGTVAPPLLHHRLAGPLALGGAGARPLPCKLRVAQSTSGPKTGSYSYLVGWPVHFIACVIPQGASPRHIWNNHFLHFTQPNNEIDIICSCTILSADDFFHEFLCC